MPRFLQQVDMDKILSLSKRRGFMFQSSEIYGGLNATWDYGPLGTELKRNVKEIWWRSMVHERGDVIGLDAAILMHPKVWETSGHVQGFTDPLVECRACHSRYRPDALTKQECPNCKANDFTEARLFNLMFKTFMGATEDTASQIYLRPETAQGIFVNFSNVLNSSRKKLPFGIAQIGKSFRNEITPGNFTFRTREFEQMEVEYFVKPGTDDDWLHTWVQERFAWYTKYGIRSHNLRIREHEPQELAHYAKGCYDIEYHFPWGWSELEGIANRTDFDLRRHAEATQENLTYFDNDTNNRYYPYAIEPSGGVDRATLAFLLDAYDEQLDTSSSKEATRTVLHFHPHIAPTKVAILPLSRNEKLVPTAQEIYSLIRQHLTTTYDDAQSIGRRYRRQDEIGTPFCVTIDFETLNDQSVTVRDRDTMHQFRTPITNLLSILKDRVLHGW